jgi:hypothetical protein
MLDYWPNKDLMTDTPLLQQSKILPFVFCGRSLLVTDIELICNVVSDFRRLSHPASSAR